MKRQAMNKQKLLLEQSWETRRGALTTCYYSSFYKRTLIVPGEDSANGKPRAVCSPQPSQLPFPFYKTVLPLLWGYLHVACHGCRPQISLLCLPQRNLSLLKKDMAVCFRSIITKHIQEKQEQKETTTTIFNKKDSSQYLTLRRSRDKAHGIQQLGAQQEC